MKLRKWQTNSVKPCEAWRRASTETQEDKTIEEGCGALTKVLGLAWDPDKDMIFFDFSKFINILTNGCSTKRFILQILDHASVTAYGCMTFLRRVTHDNRVIVKIREIQNLTERDQWSHCPGKENPVDILSRGIVASDLAKNSVWWHGPPWLSKPSEFWPDLKSAISIQQENKSLFGIEDSVEEWSKYVSFVDELVSEGLLYLIRRNLYFLLQATTLESGQSPVFMIHVHLDTFGLRFKPPLDKPKHKTLQHLLQSMVAGIFSATGLVHRVDNSRASKKYVTEMEELQELQEMREELNGRIVSVNRDAEEVLLDLQPYSYLWKEEPDSVIKSLTANPEDALGNVPQIIEQVREAAVFRAGN
ncbi:dynein beta chain, ciliary [Nephila pilipes]|uniref:Dynein beta chain, ciliary n=1 Tax=Nephila pilipes TaxID=299642 RepID=A0A8X6QNY9_NEPPI|nr:dynein beta chain, ciliary [Nephila pilipes]